MGLLGIGRVKGILWMECKMKLQKKKERKKANFKKNSILSSFKLELFKIWYLLSELY